MKLAIIVPYRDRRSNLDIFIPHMEEFLSNKQIDYKIFVSEQSDDRPFNYGKICNAIFNEIKDDYDYFCFHDVDMLPINDDADYSYKEEPTHLVFEDEDENVILPYNQYFGGVVIFKKEDFIKINGFANDYWGKGYVDLDLLFRCQKNNLPIIKNYNYSVKNSIKQDLKHRNISKRLSKVELYENSIIVNMDSNIIAKDFTLSFYYTQKPFVTSKVVLFRTLDTVTNAEKHSHLFVSNNDLQIFTVNGQLIIQFMNNNSLFQIDINSNIDLTALNHFTFVHNSKTKEFTFYLNGIEHTSKKYDIDYQFSNKNVIIGNIDNKNILELYDLKLFTTSLTINEIIKNYYYGIDSNCLDFNQLCVYQDIDVLLDKQMNIWKLMARTTVTKENQILGETKINDKLIHQFGKIKYTPIKMNGRYKLLNKKYEEIEETHHPDILENKRTYYEDLLSGRIKIDKFGLKSVKYKLLNRVDFNENTEWLKVSL
jgi:hypothetical protein